MPVETIDTHWPDTEIPVTSKRISMRILDLHIDEENYDDQTADIVKDL